MDRAVLAWRGQTLGGDRFMRNDPLQRLTTGAATAFCAAALSVYPLYIDRFSNLGVTKFTGVFTLFLLWGFAIGACVLIGARTVPAVLRRPGGTSASGRWPPLPGPRCWPPACRCRPSPRCGDWAATTAG